MHDSGLMIGHFEPLHLGQMRSILHAAGQVRTLHIVITQHPSPNPDYLVTLQDKARWLQMACRDLPFIQIHTTDEIHLPVHDNFEEVMVDIHATNTKLQLLLERLEIVPSSQNNHSDIVTDIVTDTVAGSDSTGSAGENVGNLPFLFVAENHPLAQPALYAQMRLPILTTPEQPGYHSADIARDPIAHWPAIHPEARGSYTKTVAIVGGESSGKTTLVHKLANYYGASFALEMGRLYVGTDLGGSEVGLQYSDYGPISLDHAEAIRVATYRAPAPVTFVDTDFVTTQAFCEEYEGRTHPFVAACINEVRLDHTLFLANNTPWVDDGMRSLGTESARDRFEQRLTNIFARHHIEPHRITDPDYDKRYQQAIAYINQHIYGGLPPKF